MVYFFSSWCDVGFQVVMFVRGNDALYVFWISFPFVSGRRPTHEPVQDVTLQHFSLIGVWTDDVTGKVILAFVSVNGPCGDVLARLHRKGRLSKRRASTAILCCRNDLAVTVHEQIHIRGGCWQAPRPSFWIHHGIPLKFSKVFRIYLRRGLSPVVT